MAWPELTVERIDALDCPKEKDQAIYWDGATPGLGVRVTRNGAKSFIFQSRIRRSEKRESMMRITLGDVRAWSIEQARKEARRYKHMTDTGIDPRDVRVR